MSHEQFWAWLVQMAMVHFDWTAEQAKDQSISDILLGIEGKAAFAREMAPPREDDE
jgi:hypothetical protein